MNSNRLSSSIKNVNIEEDSSILDLRIKNLLEGPSNYEDIEGRTFIKSLNRFRSVSKSTNVNLFDENRKLIQTFSSLAACARYLEVSGSTVYKYVNNNNPLKIKSTKKIFYVEKSGVSFG